jgi:hypothetical protein
MENQSVERWISFEAGSKQTIVVTPLGGDLYRLEWTPLLVDQELFLGDVIEAETLANGELSFRRLVTPSPWHHWQWILSKEVIESLAFEALKSTIEKQGGKWERYLGGIILIHLPPGTPLDPQEEMKKVINMVQTKRQDE